MKMKHYKRYMKAALVTGLFFLILMILSGCWNYKDINHRELPVAMGVSKVDDQFQVFLKIPMTKNDELKMKVLSAKGETISKAVDIISRNIESSVDLLQIKIILIEKGTAEEGMEDIISGFVRSRDISNNTLVAICDEDIEKFLSKTLEETNFYDFFEKNAGWTPEIIITRVWQVYRGIHSYTNDVAIPLLKSDENAPLKQVGSAIIKKGKMVGQLSSDESLLINAFNGESVKEKVQVMDNGTVMIKSNTVQYNSTMKNKLPMMHTKINIKVTILETKGNASEELKTELNTELTNLFNQMFNKIQDSEADILALGQFFRNELSRDELKNWRSVYYPNVNMDIQFNIDIQSEGFLKSH
jgi:spore germination protein KC